MLEIPAFVYFSLLFVAYLVGWLSRATVCDCKRDLGPKKVEGLQVKDNFEIPAYLRKPAGKRPSYYKYQIYNPSDPLSDSLGYVHLRDKASFNFYSERLQNALQALGKFKTGKISKKDEKARTIEFRRLRDALESIPHSFGRKEYKGTRKP